MKVTRTTAAILNETFELFGVPRVAAVVIGLVVVAVFRYVSWKLAALSFIGLSLGVKELCKWDRDFFRLLPAMILFAVCRVFDPFEWEPFRLVIVEDLRYDED